MLHGWVDCHSSAEYYRSFSESGDIELGDCPLWFTAPDGSVTMTDVSELRKVAEL
jgi:hypothetical protein